MPRIRRGGIHRVANFAKTGNGLIAIYCPYAVADVLQTYFETLEFNSTTMGYEQAKTIFGDNFINMKVQSARNKLFIAWRRNNALVPR